MNAAHEIGVFFDRDGTLLDEHGYLDDPDDVVLYPEALEAVRLLKDAGARLFVVTNQSGVARGLLTEETLRAIHRELERRLDGALDAVYYCPHHPELGEPPYRRDCACRKPGTGLVERALREWGLSARDCFFIGDAERDVICGRDAGLRTVFFLNGRNRQPESCSPDHVTDSLTEAARWVLRHAAARSLDRDIHQENR